MIHVEQAWAENVATAEGRVAHERVHAAETERRRGVRTVTSMPIRSDRLGVAGIADAVELRRDGDRWIPCPIEHKRGRPKAHRADEVQLCAQAMALEEMFGVAVAEGALFYAALRRRLVVPLDAGLRALTEQIAAATRALLEAGRTPRVEYESRRCDACSLLDLCRPRITGATRSARAWIGAQVEG